MPNITMTIDEATLKSARRLAVDKGTTLTALIREYLEQLALREQQRTEDVISQLQESFSKSPIAVGKPGWTRDELHER